MNANYKCITSVEGIREYIGDAKIIAFDYETAPDEAYRNEDKAALDAHKAHIVGCSFSVSEGSGIYVPVAHKVGKNIEPTAFDKYLREFLENTAIVKIAHNLAFESQMSYAHDIVIMPPVYDTIAASQMSLKSCTEFRTAVPGSVFVTAMWNSTRYVNSVQLTACSYRPKRFIIKSLYRKVAHIVETI